MLKCRLTAQTTKLDSSHKEAAPMKGQRHVLFFGGRTYVIDSRHYTVTFVCMERRWTGPNCLQSQQVGDRSCTRLNNKVPVVGFWRWFCLTIHHDIVIWNDNADDDDDYHAAAAAAAAAAGEMMMMMIVVVIIIIIIMKHNQLYYSWQQATW